MIRFIKWSILLFIVWLLLTSSIHYQELIVGAILSLVIALFASKLNSQCISGITNPFKWFIYIIIFFKNLIAANINVATIVLKPKLPINPGIIKLKTNADTNFKKLVIANSITLTPGTITLDVIDDYFYVHWINVETDDMEKASKIIKGDFEKYIL